MYFFFSINKVAWLSYSQILSITGILKLKMFNFGIGTQLCFEHKDVRLPGYSIKNKLFEIFKFEGKF